MDATGTSGSPRGCSSSSSRFRPCPPTTRNPGAAAFLAPVRASSPRISSLLVWRVSWRLCGGGGGSEMSRVGECGGGGGCGARRGRRRTPVPGGGRVPGVLAAGVGDGWVWEGVWWWWWGGCEGQGGGGGGAVQPQHEQAAGAGVAPVFAGGKFALLLAWFDCSTSF